MKQIISHALALITRRPAAAIEAQPVRDPQAIRAALVGSYMAGQASSLRSAWDVLQELDNPALAGEGRMLQAAAAAAEAMSQMLLAFATEDRAGFRHHFLAFMNDAVETGVVAG